MWQALSGTELNRIVNRQATAARSDSVGRLSLGVGVRGALDPLNPFTRALKAARGQLGSVGFATGSMADALRQPERTDYQIRGNDLVCTTPATRDTRIARVVEWFEQRISQRITARQSKFLRAQNRALRYPVHHQAFPTGDRLVNPARPFIMWEQRHIEAVGREVIEAVGRRFGFV